MNVKFHNSIALKITLLVLGGASLVCSLVLAYSYYSSKKIILNDAEQNAQNLALSVARTNRARIQSRRKIASGNRLFPGNNQVEQRISSSSTRALGDGQP